MAHYSFVPTYYQFSPMGISASKAAYLLSLVSIFNTIGRLTAIFESNKLSVDLMIALHLVIGVFAQILLYSAQNSETLTWIANSVHGMSTITLYLVYLF